jgi:hypothetical protein
MGIRVEQTHWGYIASTMDGGYLVTRKYQGYSKREVRQLFREYLADRREGGDW